MDEIQDITKTNKLTLKDMPRIGALNTLITKEAIYAEGSLQSIANREPWFPDLVNAIREVSLWKFISKKEIQYKS